MNKNNDFTPYVFECTINTDVVTGCFENFIEKIDQETHVIMDNAPVHKSYKFLSCLPEWEKKGLHAVFLSAYSPELNLIEILWRKIKYEWLPFAAYTSFKALTECIEDILINFGSQYIIEFQ
jgi:transposase